MNENIVNSIEQYVKDVNPQYAMLLSGSWGCGKTHFIETWCVKYIKELSKGTNRSKKVKCISPIKVSLFGTSSISDIYERIREALNPKLFKVSKIGSKLISAASKALLNGDVLEGAEVPVEADIAVWEGFNKDAKGCRLLILDDLERSRVPIVEILGLVDMFLNMYDFHVIIIGDEGHIKETERAEYYQYKEKIIGQTLTVQKDSLAAFEVFAKEIEEISKKAATFVKGNKECLLDIFNASGYSNLRSLKQSLHQFAFLYKQLKAGADDYKREVLANYIAISMELHNDSSLDWEKITYGIRLNLGNRDDESTRLQSKYQFIEGKHQVHLFVGYNGILLALKDGKEIANDVNVEIDRRKNKPLYETYKWYYKMSNADFSNNTKKVHDYLASPIDRLYDYILLLYLYCKVQHEGLIPINEEFVDECIDRCIDMLYGVANLNNFVAYESCVAKALSSTSYELEIPLFEKVKVCLWDVINAQKVKLKDNLTNILESLSDDKIESFKDVITGPDPYHQANYELLSIFDKINVDAFVNGFLSLSNENKEIVRIFIGHRYDQLRNSIDLRVRLLPDKDNLKAIKDRLEIEEKQMVSIEKLQVNKFIKMIEDAIVELQKQDIRG